MAIICLPLSPGIQPCWADKAVVSTTTTTTTTRTELEPFVPVSTVPSVVVLKAHTGSKYPQSLILLVGQKLAIKGNNAIDLLTLRYHQADFNHCPSGKDSLKAMSEKGYKETFLAVRPGETTLNIDSNSMYNGLIPWRSHKIHVTVLPADAEHSLAARRLDLPD